jgi:AcrR family transcriptional regulator
VAAATEAARAGRPSKVDDAGVATRERLLAAAVASCVQHGFDGATVTDIAGRADVSAPAIYNHFGGKVELMVAAGRWALDRLRPVDGASLSAVEVVRAFLADSFADSRRLLVELELAGQRHPELADLMARWHVDHAVGFRRRVSGADPRADAVVATYFALLLGLCQVDALGALGVPTPAIAQQAEALVHVLFPSEVPQ